MSNKQKKQVVIFMYETVNKPLGGLGVHMQNFLKGFDDQYYFTIVGFSNSKRDNVIEGENFTALEVGHHLNLHEEDIDRIQPMTKATLFNLEVLQVALQQLDVQPDIVHICDWTLAQAGFSYASSRHASSRLVYATHLSPYITDMRSLETNNPTTDEQKFSYDSKMVTFSTEKYALENADYTTFVSQHNANMVSRFIDPACTKVIPNGVNLDEFKGLKKEKNDVFTFLYVGRLERQKGIYDMIEAFKEFEQMESKKVKLKIMAPKTSLYNYVMDQCSQSDNIEYIGYKEGKEKNQEMVNADCIVMPSKYEPFGLVGLEAFASKTLLISSQVDGLGEFTNDENSIYGESKLTLLSAYDRALNMSKEEKVKFILNGYNTAKKYTWKSVQNSYLSIYESLIEDK